MRITPANLTDQRSRRLGSRRLGAILSTELVLVLPLVITLLLAVVEFGMIMQARGSVVEASRVAGRLAAQSYATSDDVDLAARRALGRKLGQSADVNVVVGDHPGDRVVVGVSVPMAAATPDFLFWCGLSHRGKQLTAVSEFVKE